jgi:phosphatidylglycerophosphate synthase
MSLWENPNILPVKWEDTNTLSSWAKLSKLYRDFITGFDRLGMSPNRLVTLRTGTAIASAAILGNGWVENTTVQCALVWSFLLSLVADRFDGDLARFTNQCSKEGEILDAGADKLVVYATLLTLIGPKIWNMSHEQVIFLVGLFTANGTMDFISQLSRGLEENKKALCAFWKTPTSQNEREKYSYSKTSSGANMMGKLKTGAIMTALGVWISQGVLGYSEDTLVTILMTGLSVSATFSATSLWLKWKK